MSDSDDFRGKEEVAEHYDVADLHAPVWHEHEEPDDGMEPVPTWMSFLFGGVLFAGGIYMATFAADLQPHTYDGVNLAEAEGWQPAEVPGTEDQLIRLGREVYRNCQQCHGVDGKGQPPEYPPLAGAEWVVGDKASDARLIQTVMYGVSGTMQVGEEYYSGLSPAFGGQLRDAEIAAVLTFIRKEWGNNGEAIFPDAVSEIRRENKLRGPLTVEELESIPVTE